MDSQYWVHKTGVESITWVKTNPLEPINHQGVEQSWTPSQTHTHSPVITHTLSQSWTPSQTRTHSPVITHTLMVTTLTSLTLLTRKQQRHVTFKKFCFSRGYHWEIFGSPNVTDNRVIREGQAIQMTVSSTLVMMMSPRKVEQQCILTVMITVKSIANRRLCGFFLQKKLVLFGCRACFIQ